MSTTTTIWHKLLHASGKHVWSQNVRIVKNTCVSQACPGKPFLLQGRIRSALLWYAPQDVVQSVHVTRGEHRTEEGCGTCGACARVFAASR
jgi:hypothetical protein